MVKQLTGQLEAAMQANKEMEATNKQVVSVINENKQLRSYLAELYTEAKARITQANQQTMLANQRIRETTSDASHLAKALAQQEAGAVAPNEGSKAQML